MHAGLKPPVSTSGSRLGVVLDFCGLDALGVKPMMPSREVMDDA
jgi:hypothetical protein